MDGVQAEIQLMRKAAATLDDSLVKEWIKQGHHLTGAWEKSLHGTVLNAGKATVARGMMNTYGVYVDSGVMADRIPYGGTKTGATTSKYITGLYNFWRLRGLGDKEALRAAFATAKTHKRDGMPSAGSYRFSESGQRTQFIEIVNNTIDQEINEIIGDGLDEIVDAKFHETKTETI